MEEPVQTPCRLPYPERYDRALEFYNNWPDKSKQPSQDTQLILFGLSSQVSQGPCKDPQPSSWNTLETAKWTAWHGLKDMDKNEAMRLFVKTLEEEEVHRCKVHVLLV
jgi:acyl-CoA-binding protein